MDALRLLAPRVQVFSQKFPLSKWASPPALAPRFSSASVATDPAIITSSATVCRSGRMIIVDGIVEAEALERDVRGRELPVWQACRTVQSGEVFLMNAGVPDSFDGRYFRPVPDSTIIGSATPLSLSSEHLSRNPGP